MNTQASGTTNISELSGQLEDKANKLQALFGSIHLIDTRCEALKRDEVDGSSIPGNLP